MLLATFSVNFLVALFLAVIVLTAVFLIIGHVSTNSSILFMKIVNLGHVVN